MRNLCVVACFVGVLVIALYNLAFALRKPDVTESGPRELHFGRAEKLQDVRSSGEQAREDRQLTSAASKQDSALETSLTKLCDRLRFFRNSFMTKKCVDEAERSRIHDITSRIKKASADVDPANVASVKALHEKLAVFFI